MVESISRRALDGLCPVCGRPAPSGSVDGDAHIATHGLDELIAAAMELSGTLVEILHRNAPATGAV